MNVLVVAPHPDDETIGCGGTLLRHVDAGDRTYVVFLTSGELSHGGRPPEEVRELREREASAAAAVLGVDDYVFLRRPDYGVSDDLDGAALALNEIMRSYAAELIYVPHRQEWHPDHKAAFAITAQVTGALDLSPDSILTYEVWTPLTEFSVVEDITEQMPRKLQAIRCYSSQLETFDYVRAASGLNQYRGALAAHADYAEVFGQPTEEDLQPGA